MANGHGNSNAQHGHRNDSSGKKSGSKGTRRRKAKSKEKGSPNLNNSSLGANGGKKNKRIKTEEPAIASFEHDDIMEDEFHHIYNNDAGGKK